MSIQIKPIEQAPNLQELKEKFWVSEKDVIISYGDSIYCPAEGMSRDLLVHEMVHCERQGMNEESAKRWWKNYMEDTEFRLQEEAEAYKEQFNYCKRVYKDRNARARIQHALAKDLSSSRYGCIVNYSDAMKLINDGNVK